MNFLNDPKYKSIRVVLVIIVIASAGWFVASNMNQSGVQTGMVLNEDSEPSEVNDDGGEEPDEICQPISCALTPDADFFSFAESDEGTSPSPNQQEQLEQAKKDLIANLLAQCTAGLISPALNENNAQLIAAGLIAFIQTKHPPVKNGMLCKGKEMDPYKNDAKDSVKQYLNQNGGDTINAGLNGSCIEKVVNNFVNDRGNDLLACLPKK